MPSHPAIGLSPETVAAKPLTPEALCQYYGLPVETALEARDNSLGNQDLLDGS
jgi:hypothetical protein